MKKEVEGYNKFKKSEFLSKLYNDTYTSNDLKEFIVNARIDSTIQNREKREHTKMKVSQLRELVEKLNKM